MTALELGVTIWLIVSEGLVILALIVGSLKFRTSLWQAPVSDNTKEKEFVPVPVEIILALKGSFPGLRETLHSVLRQTYPLYNVIFVLEDDDDPAMPVVRELSRRFSNTRIVIGGLADACSQKNHSLIAGLNNLKPETEILVFYDCTNEADPEWLTRFVRPILAGETEVVTTFRSFDPEPPTLGGMCQALYASAVTLLKAFFPLPWGGGTAIRRSTLEKLNLKEEWSKTVIDDLVLGNLLLRDGVGIRMDMGCQLRSPLKNQSIQACIHYLDRQILFPKFTNPGVWAATVAGLTNIAMVSYAALIGTILFVAGLTGWIFGVLSVMCLIVIAPCLMCLHKINGFGLPVARWLILYWPSILLIAAVCLRTLFRTRVEWHGRVYTPGKRGIVLETGFLDPR